VVQEAQLKRTESGLEPAGDGWFVLNARDAKWHDGHFGAYTRFEGESRFTQIGVNIGVLAPGQPACFYHGEDDQEDFLVLSGECIAIVEGRERRLRQWDFLHCPAGTEHIVVGTGPEPCVVFMAGARANRGSAFYPRNEVALRHGVSVEADTTSGREAYTPFPGFEPGPPESFDGLPFG
jgi:uncharacterized cupin superfamily protein